MWSFFKNIWPFIIIKICLQKLDKVGSNFLPNNEKNDQIGLLSFYQSGEILPYLVTLQFIYLPKNAYLKIRPLSKDTNCCSTDELKFRFNARTVASKTTQSVTLRQTSDNATLILHNFAASGFERHREYWPRSSHLHQDVASKHKSITNYCNGDFYSTNLPNIYLPTT